MFRYKILEDTSRYTLESRVEELMKEGWKPQGGVSAFKDGWNNYYQQAMVKT